ncbi:hypothetical protein N7532_011941 [Penicillium argentinense]|uniref:VOC domain-containing protein n=1 Tax=Penicillium argentinense TaxID=1131581 RepID=A0A9W9EJG2_9EURO|nr:uncharacterized protein N7532_011941 [Penicillium argentinense]KAJ5082898.1 hypothetical protein N7532_011941 [Penicillium argentinense]
MATANKGASIPDTVAVGSEQETIETWRHRSKIDQSSQIRLLKLAHMRYRHPDLEQITAFLLDFGMTVAKRTDDEIWYRGYGEDQYVYYARKRPKKFLGGTFAVESFEDLEKASQLPTAGNIQELSDSPGGGFMLILTDPEGFPINLMFGQAQADRGDYPDKLSINYEEDEPRIRRFQRFKPGPAAVHKLGHFGVCTQQFDGLVDFYTNTFNIVPTDFLYVENEGKKKNVAVLRGPSQLFHQHKCYNPCPHCSFEVHDFDTQKLGHQWLADKKYESVWGVGRHILGSQIFDYWWDTTGNTIEHYADGDLVNDQTPIGYGPAGDESLAVWGPEVPAWFLN